VPVIIALAELELELETARLYIGVYDGHFRVQLLLQLPLLVLSFEQENANTLNKLRIIRNLIQPSGI
jgi:hypothetical protein